MTTTENKEFAYDEIIKEMLKYPEDTHFSTPIDVYGRKTATFPRRESLSKIAFFHLYWTGKKEPNTKFYIQDEVNGRVLVGNLWEKRVVVTIKMTNTIIEALLPNTY